MDGTDDPEALGRLAVVEGADLMRERFTAAAKAFGVSRATCHPWKKLPREGGVRGWFRAAAGVGRAAGA